MTEKQGPQGKGRHPHKDREEAYPHTKQSSSRRKAGESENKQSHAGSKPGQGGAESLESREYKDDQGNIHHHTKTYVEQHGKK